MRRFRLQALLDYRKRLADHAYQAVVASMEHQSAISKARQQAERDRQRLCRELESAKTTALHMEEILLYEQCISAKQRQVRQLEERLIQAQADVEDKQQQLLEARREKRVMEKLREKRRDAEKKKLAHQEAIMLDEVAVLGFGGSK